MKVSRTVWAGGKTGDYFKGLPIGIGWNKSMMDDRNREWFNDLLEEFLTEKIDHEDFIAELGNYSQGQVEAIGEKTYFQWLPIKKDYIADKKFNQNEGQISLS